MSSYGHYGPLDSRGQDQLKKLVDDITPPTNDYYIINQYTSKIANTMDTVEECEQWIMDNGKDPYIIAKHVVRLKPVFKKTLVRSEE